MAIDLKSSAPLPVSGNPSVQAVLDDLQCNILAPHRCHNSYHLFITLPKSRDEARRYALSWGDKIHGEALHAPVTRATTTSSWLRYEHSRQQAYRSYHLTEKLSRWFSKPLVELMGGSAKPPAATRGPVRSFMLSCSGLLFLRRNQEPWPLPRDPQFDIEVALSEAGFFGGSVAAALQEWRPPFNGTDLHAQILLADDDPAALSDAMTAETKRLEDDFGGKVLGGRFGYRKQNAAGADVEHFGYADGISNPLFLETDLTHPDYAAIDPARLLEEHFYPKKNVLFELPGAPGTYGSFQVFRQIEQNIAAFQTLANRDAIIGRHTDGTPLVQSRTDALNDFDYEDDPPSGKPAVPRCPFHAHIRKANPRTGQVDPHQRSAHRAVQFVRRAMAYGEYKLDHTQRMRVADSGPVGLLFMGYMGSIDGQFFKMQRDWFGGFSFPPNAPVSSGNWDRLAAIPQPPASAPTVVRGGCYFFVPPISWLRNLSP